MLRKYFSLFTIVFTIFSLNSYAAELQVTEAQASNTQTNEKKEIYAIYRIKRWYCYS